MPIATTLPANNVTLRFPPHRLDQDGAEVEESYQLLELPAEILKAVEKGTATVPLTIKGTPSDDAVLCTPTSTFLLRTISISNSLLICRTPPADPSDRDPAGGEPLEIRGINHEVLECVPQAADLERIRRLLKESQWQGMEHGEPAGKRQRLDGKGGKRWTRAQLESVVQASEEELERGLRERNVIERDGYLLMLPSLHLQPLLNLVLTLLTIHMTSTGLEQSPPFVISPVEPLFKTLEEDHDVETTLVHGVLDLFGEVKEDEWKCDIKRVVGEMGMGMIQSLPAQGQRLDTFMGEWKAEVGEMWAELVDVALLEGNYLLTDPPVSTIFAPSPIITYFSVHSLPLHAPTRFADLFLTRQKWTPEEMTPFLKGLTRDGDKKELDKLIAKFVRVVKDGKAVSWFPRRTG